MIDLSFDLNKEFILKRVSQEEIFERYLKLKVDYRERFTSPLRVDNNPTCQFKKTQSGVVLFIDYSGHFKGDCFSLVMFIHRCSFPKALSFIAKEFNLIENGPVKEQYHTFYEKQEKKETIIKVQYRKPEEKDIKYWLLHGISRSTLSYFNVFCIKAAWINDKLVYLNNPKDPCYGYRFEEKFKLYFPNRSKYRFMNNFSDLQGYTHLSETGELLVVTKSYKDVMFFYELGIPAVAPSSEAAILTKEQFSDLYNRFDRIVSFYDFDLTGIRSANKMKRLYEIKPIFLTNGRFNSLDYKAKDPTDLVKKVGFKKSKNVCLNLLKDGRM